MKIRLAFIVLFAAVLPLAAGLVSGGGQYTTYAPMVQRLATSTPPPPPPDVRIIALYVTSEPENVAIRNLGGAPQDMTGWYLVSVIDNQVFYFPSGFTLQAFNQSLDYVYISSGKGAEDSPPQFLLWDYSEIWRNAGDVAELYNADGVLVYSRCYGNVSC